MKCVPALVRINQMLQNTQFSNGGGLVKSHNDKLLISNGAFCHSREGGNPSSLDCRIKFDNDRKDENDITFDNIISAENLLLAWQELTCNVIPVEAGI